MNPAKAFRLGPKDKETWLATNKSAKRYRRNLERLIVETGLDDATGVYPFDAEFRKQGASIAIVMAAARALLLQIAHPTVAQGVFDFSDFERDPIGRGIRTFLGVFMVGFGRQSGALWAGEKVFATHQTIKGHIPPYGNHPEGRKYTALEPGANLWVWATLVEGIVYGHDILGSKLSKRKIEQMYQESKLFGQFFNVRPSKMPETWQDFITYFNETVDHELFVTQAGKEVADALVKGGKFPYKQSGFMLRAFAVETLPPTVRHQFGWVSTLKTRTIFGAIRNAAKAYVAIAPEEFTRFPVIYAPQMRQRLDKLRGNLKTKFPTSSALLHAA